MHRLSQRRASLTIVTNREPLRFGRVLKLIDKGELAVLESPSLNEQALPGEQMDHTTKFIEWMLSLLPKTPANYVEDCWAKYLSDFSNKTEEETRAVVEAQIAWDLRRLQVQPVIRSDYRRFVVIKGCQDTHIEWDHEGVSGESSSACYYPHAGLHSSSGRQRTSSTSKMGSPLGSTNHNQLLHLRPQKMLL